MNIFIKESKELPKITLQPLNRNTLIMKIHLISVHLRLTAL